MRLSELFQPPDLIVGFSATDKWDAITRLVDRLVENGRIPSEAAGEIRQAVLARERSMSTGMELGIAIPHAAVESVASIAACMGIVGRPEGLAFDSIDGRPARLIVLLVIPKAQKLLHIRTLADVARVLGNAAVREALTTARTSADAWEALRAGDLEPR